MHNYESGTLPREVEVAIIGTGMGSLSAAITLNKLGISTALIDQNWQVGGCTTSYWRKGYVFEAGATTLVGLEQDRPLGQVLKGTGIKIPARKLEVPMQVHLPDNSLITRFENIQQWIQEAELRFGKKGQDRFWSKAYRISRFVWKNALRQRYFPPLTIYDYYQALRHVSREQLIHLRYAFYSMQDMMEQMGLSENTAFRDFVDAQLMITAQNTQAEVNQLFGSAALCYTNDPNYYVEGGMRHVVEPMAKYLSKHGHSLSLRNPVKAIHKEKKGYVLETKKGAVKAQHIISGIPLNNTAELADFNLSKRARRRMMESDQLVSAFQMSLGLHQKVSPAAIHQQVLLEKPLPKIGSESYFVSFGHAADPSRGEEVEGTAVSISAHIRDPAHTRLESTEEIEQAILRDLDDKGIIAREHIAYKDSSTPGAWSKWTGRKYGFVGGYPQYFDIKPWQMVESRIDNGTLYLCGDTAYPGQGIPGACLSGLIAAHKLFADHYPNEGWTRWRLPFL